MCTICYNSQILKTEPFIKFTIFFSINGCKLHFFKHSTIVTCGKRTQLLCRWQHSYCFIILTVHKDVYPIHIFRHLKVCPVRHFIDRKYVLQLFCLQFQIRFSIDLTDSSYCIQAFRHLDIVLTESICSNCYVHNSK